MLRLAALAPLVVAVTSVQDTPSLVIHKSIGEVRLGMARSDVQAAYGSGRTRRFRNYFPVGTKYHGKVLYRTTYWVHGGKLTVSYVDGRVKMIETTSRYYRTTSGVGVGTHIPRGPCHRDEYGGCHYRWRGFEYDECGGAWLSGTTRLTSILYVRRARVYEVQLGEDDVVLYCF
jgi:prepilin-type processing-associated H-X9-DG protein